MNGGTVELEALGEADLGLVRTLVHRHFERTQSALAWRVLSGWKAMSKKLVKVMPTDYKRALAAQAPGSSPGTIRAGAV